MLHLARGSWATLLARSRSASSAVRFSPEMHHLLRRQKVPLHEAFGILQTRTSPYDIKGCDAFFFSCLQEAPLPPAFVDQVAAFFSQVLEHDAAGPREGAFSSMVALLTQSDRTDLALELLKKKHAKNPDVQPHYRSYAPLLEHYIQANDLEKAWSFWEYVKSIGTTQPPEKVGPTMVLFASKALGVHQRIFQNVLQELNALRYQLTPDDVALWMAITRDRPGYTTTQLDHAEMLPTCAHCDATLTKLPVTPAELEALLQAVETMCVESQYIPSDPKATPPPPMTRETKLKALRAFEKWLATRHAMVPPGKLHYIVDAPNVAYLNQNFEGGAFRFDYIDQLAKHVQAEGHVASATMPAYYFEEVSYLSVKTANRNPYKKSGTRYFRTRTPEDKAFLDAWAADDFAFRARREVASDDLYWMYATFYLLSLDAKAGVHGHRVRVVTNDEIKDHISALEEKHNIRRDLVERWKDTTCVGVSLNFEKKVAQVTLHDPLPFSRVVQDHGETYHLPTTNGLTWLCVSPSTP
ncbi:hypothetical protein SPRG_04563 [Saprolegnia parasitica CBS 223.65]|uniref:ribonuclease P n=1 Tax=Saprolegnia parasitica (strain CBS 223.65) TaxID=695850 RepID=A0A067CV68_SAPPC|nr:hypothetical protein SPRG_04563 [Saprolegnia parasitica CBS 223.65]KDO30662.1 hypothetical protein SPRG_04563 [Saprolegnia parasitica CBS 223.65]|eukprot:XP_012198366.1 hypothetical protein SPRG_04563 [Saprolegnia parasitica CBS 223.65]